MTPEQRLELIRAKVCRAVPAPYAAAGLKRASVQLPPRKPLPYQHPTGGNWIVFKRGGYSHVKEPGMDWIGEPDKEPERPRVAPKKRRKGKHYLSEIAEKMPGKLPVMPSAD